MVTPFVGVWIETTYCLRAGQYMPSHPSWVCGLKHLLANLLITADEVTPFVGVWIETHGQDAPARHHQVTPFVGVWIETCRGRNT